MPGPTQELVTEICASVLNRRAIQPDDNLFDLGADSLLAAQLIARLETAFEVDLVERFFENPCVSALAAAIDQLREPTTAGP